MLFRLWFMKKKMVKEITQKILNDNLLKLVIPVLKDFDAYLVGGYVRDLFLNKSTNDRDIVVFSVSPEIIARKIQEKINGYFVELDAQNQIYRVIDKNKIDYIDIALGIGENIFEDLKRRDFTINAIAINLKNYEIIDIFDGIKDLKDKKIKLIKEENLFEDALRMIRAPRFQAILGFEIDEKIFELVSQHKKLLDCIANERINYELMRIFEGVFCVEGLLSLDKMELVDKFFPEMIEVKKIPPNSHHHLPLFFHCLETTKQVHLKVNKYDEKITNYFEEKILGAHSRFAYLKLASFLHDVGKPDTWTIDEETGRHRFIKHDDVGAQKITQTLKNLKFSNKQIKYIQNLIKYHIYPSALISEEEVSEKVLNRYFRKMGEYALDIIFLAMGDRLSARGEAITDEIVEKNISHLNSMIDFYFNNFLNQKPLEKLLDGNEIMEILKIGKSPKLGQIIKALQEAQINSEVITKEDAINFIKNNNFLD